ncbi:MAG: hypothetical protein IPG99_20815 [Ignavibacteria bacterium]|nr:hypothetical protein [Ignavibacteria bacterium]
MNGSENLFIPLPLTPGAEGVYLRSLCGADEMMIEDTGTKNLISLLEKLMHAGAEANKVRAAQIVTADRDRLLAALYISLYGAKVESTVTCKKCEEKFDLDFSLHALLKHFGHSTTPFSENGKYELEPGLSFRLPTGEDEIQINGFTGAEAEKKLLERCLLEGNAETDSERVQLKMEELAPMLSMHMQAICPECSHDQEVQFDMQSFFLTKLIQERQGLIREIHYIASQYHWSHQEILDLPRNLRKQYAALIQPEN